MYVNVCVSPDGQYNIEKEASFICHTYTEQP